MSGKDPYGADFQKAVDQRISAWMRDNDPGQYMREGTVDPSAIKGPGDGFTQPLVAFPEGSEVAQWMEAEVFEGAPGPPGEGVVGEDGENGLPGFSGLMLMCSAGMAGESGDAYVDTSSWMPDGFDTGNRVLLVRLDLTIEFDSSGSEDPVQIDLGIANDDLEVPVLIRDTVPVYLPSTGFPGSQQLFHVSGFDFFYGRIHEGNNPRIFVSFPDGAPTVDWAASVQVVVSYARGGADRIVEETDGGFEITRYELDFTELMES